VHARTEQTEQKKAARTRSDLDASTSVSIPFHLPVLFICPLTCSFIYKTLAPYTYSTCTSMRMAAATAQSVGRSYVEFSSL
jgi:hypothetical protein